MNDVFHSSHELLRDQQWELSPLPMSQRFWDWKESITHLRPEWMRWVGPRCWIVCHDGWRKMHLAKILKVFFSVVNFQIHCRHKQAVLWSDAILTLWTCSYSALTSYSSFTGDKSHLTCQVHTSHSKLRYNFPTHETISRFSLQVQLFP